MKLQVEIDCKVREIRGLFVRDRRHPPLGPCSSGVGHVAGGCARQTVAVQRPGGEQRVKPVVDDGRLRHHDARAQEFVKATRPKDMDYMAVGITPPARSLKPKKADAVKQAGGRPDCDARPKRPSGGHPQHPARHCNGRPPPKSRRSDESNQRLRNVITGRSWPEVRRMKQTKGSALLAAMVLKNAATTLSRTVLRVIFSRIGHDGFPPDQAAAALRFEQVNQSRPPPAMAAPTSSISAWAILTSPRPSTSSKSWSRRPASRARTAIPLPRGSAACAAPRPGITTAASA